VQTLGDPDTDTEHQRRVKAPLIMANPDQALTLIQALATHTNGDTTDDGNGARYDADDAPLPTGQAAAPSTPEPPTSAAATPTPDRRASIRESIRELRPAPPDSALERRLRALLPAC
jgi:hypothetical protein